MNEIPAPLVCQRVQEWKTEDILFCVARRTDSDRLYVGSSDFRVYEIVITDDGLARHEFSGDAHQSYVTGMAIAGDSLVSGSYDGRLIWWNGNDRVAVRAVEAHTRWIRRVLATPDQSRIVSIADDMQCRIWNASSGELLHCISDHATVTPHHFPSMLHAATISPDGKLLATGDKIGHVAVWDLETNEKIGEVNAPEMYTWDPRQRIHSIGGIRSLAFSPDSQRLAVGGIGQIENIDHLGGPSRVEVFEWRTQQRLQTMSDEKQQGLVEQIVWRPYHDRWHLVCAGGDHKGFITVWDADSAEMVTQAQSEGHLHGFAADPSLATLFAACHERLEKWEISS
jgi:WD40 repeat protein